MSISEADREYFPDNVMTLYWELLIRKHILIKGPVGMVNRGDNTSVRSEIQQYCDPRFMELLA